MLTKIKHYFHNKKIENLKHKLKSRNKLYSYTTKDERIIIYKRLLEHVSSVNTYEVCFCFALIKVTTYPENPNLQAYPELMVQKPKHYRSLWFKADKTGKEKRIHLIKNAIELCSI